MVHIIHERQAKGSFEKPGEIFFRHVKPLRSSSKADLCGKMILQVGQNFPAGGILRLSGGFYGHLPGIKPANNVQQTRLDPQLVGCGLADMQLHQPEYVFPHAVIHLRPRQNRHKPGFVFAQWQQEIPAAVQIEKLQGGYGKQNGEVLGFRPVKGHAVNLAPVDQEQSPGISGETLLPDGQVQGARFHIHKLRLLVPVGRGASAVSSAANPIQGEGIFLGSVKNRLFQLRMHRLPLPFSAL